MREETTLDFAAFQLSPRRTRYALYLCGDGETEKLNGWDFGPLLAELPAAKEVLNGSGHVFKLQLSEEESNDAAWFSKGTLERFLHLVENPEILERVNAIHAEIAQIETAKKFNLTLYSQDKDNQQCKILHSTDKEKDASEDFLISTNQITMSDPTRNDLLRAFDGRLSALRGEFNAALAHAYAVGFSVAEAKELATFSQRFGASRLRDACATFVASCENLDQCASAESSTSQVSAMENGTSMGSPETVGLAMEQEDSEDRGPPKRAFMRSASPRTRRAVSPMRRVQLGRTGSRRSSSSSSTFRRINYFSDRNCVNKDSRDLEDCDNENSEEDVAESSDENSKTESNRRLSVLDAVKLFEQKQQLKQPTDKTNRGFPDQRRTSASSQTACSVFSKTSDQQTIDSEETEQSNLNRKEVYEEQHRTPRGANNNSAFLWSLQDQDQRTVDIIQGLDPLAVDGTNFADVGAKSIVDEYLSSFAEAHVNSRAIEHTDEEGRSQENSAHGDVWSTKMERDIHILMNIVGSNLPSCQQEKPQLQFCQSDDRGYSKELKGRFYDQYRQKRDAKLREDLSTTKVENQAKLKAMHETLEKRKAEISGKTSKSSDKQNSLSDDRREAQKSQLPKTRVYFKYKSEQQNVVSSSDTHRVINGLQDKDLNRLTTRSQHDPPRSANERAKTNCSRKVSSKKSSLARGAASLALASPKPLRISGNNDNSSGKRRVENSGSRSVTNSYEQKKDTGRSTASRSGSNSATEKNRTLRSKTKSSLTNKVTKKSPPSDGKGFHLASGVTNKRDEIKTRGGLVKRSSASDGEKVTEEKESQLTPKPSFYSKVTKKSSVVPLEHKSVSGKEEDLHIDVILYKDMLNPSSKRDNVIISLEEESNSNNNLNIEAVAHKEALESALLIPQETQMEHGYQLVENQRPSDNLERIVFSNGLENTSPFTVPEEIDLNNLRNSSDHEAGKSLKLVSEEPTPCTLSKEESSSDNPEGASPNYVPNCEVSCKEELYEVSVAPLELSGGPVTMNHNPCDGLGIRDQVKSRTTSSLHTKHSLSDMLAVESTVDQSLTKFESTQNNIQISNHPQKDSRKGLKRLLKLGRKSRPETAAQAELVLRAADEDIEELKHSSANNAFFSHDSKGASSTREFISGRSSQVNSNVTKEKSSLLKGPRSFFSFRSKCSDSKSK